MSNTETQEEIAARELGLQIKRQRKALKVTAIAAAESANMSRVTWHRIERGATSVTLGAWLSALRVLGLQFNISSQQQTTTPSGLPEHAVPTTIAVKDYPQLQRLAWQLTDDQVLSPKQALSIYERNWRHINESELAPQERALVEALQLVFRGSMSDV